MFVTSTKETRSVGESGGTFSFPFGAEGNRAFRNGMTSEERTFSAEALSGIDDEDWMNEASFPDAASKEGGWVYKMGLRDIARIAGRSSFVWG